MAKHGTEHHKAKLDDKKVRAIRKACRDAQGRRPLAELSEKYGVSTSTIVAVAERRTWAHVED